MPRRYNVFEHVAHFYFMICRFDARTAGHWEPVMCRMLVATPSIIQLTTTADSLQTRKRFLSPRGAAVPVA